MMEFERVDESQQQERQKKQRRKRDGPGVVYYEDDSKLQLEFGLVQKFAKLQVSPPIDINELEKTQ